MTIEVLKFRGQSAGTAPATWGQRHVWPTLADHPGDTAQFTLRQAWRIPPGCPAVDVLAALRQLIERHESLRTHFLVQDGQLVQLVSASGELAVSLTDVGHETHERAAAEAAHRLAETPFDHAAEIPVRFGILTAAGVPLRVVIALSHMAADGDAFEILERDFTTLVSQKKTPGPPTCQPRAWSRRENSPTGLRRNSRSLDYLLTTLRDRSEPLFPKRLGLPAESGFPTILAHARGVGAKVEAFAHTVKASASAVCLAALSRSLARHSGVGSFALGATFSNRFLPDASGYVGMLAQNGVVGVEADAPIRHLAVSLRYSLLAAHRYAAYDQDSLDTELAGFRPAEECVGFGAVPNFVNFQMRPSVGVPPALRAESTAQGIAVSQVKSVDYRMSRFGIFLTSDGTDMGVRMFIDPAALSVDNSVAIVRDCLTELDSLE